MRFFCLSESIYLNNFYISFEKKNNSSGYVGLISTHGLGSVLDSKKLFYSVSLLTNLIVYHLSISGTVVFLLGSAFLRDIVVNEIKFNVTSIAKAKLVILSDWKYGSLINEFAKQRLLKKNKIGLTTYDDYSKILVCLVTSSTYRKFILRELLAKNILVVNFAGSPYEFSSNILVPYQVVMGIDSVFSVSQLLIYVIKKGFGAIS